MYCINTESALLLEMLEEENVDFRDSNKFQGIFAQLECLRLSSESRTRVKVGWWKYLNPLTGKPFITYQDDESYLNLFETLPTISWKEGTSGTLSWMKQKHIELRSASEFRTSQPTQDVIENYLFGSSDIDSLQWELEEPYDESYTFGDLLNSVFLRQATQVRRLIISFIIEYCVPKYGEGQDVMKEPVEDHINNMETWIDNCFRMRLYCGEIPYMNLSSSETLVELSKDKAGMYEAQITLPAKGKYTITAYGGLEGLILDCRVILRGKFKLVREVKSETNISLTDREWATVVSLL